uniref:ARAD1C28600p n=1 Tax=Blastobotrys adeninivorans TaxID=409370 RepID=A0A060T228_BLAAD
MTDTPDVDMKENGVNGTQELTAEEKARREQLEATDPGALQQMIEEKARAYLAKQTHRVIIPSYAAWFDRQSINEVEKKSLPEFFNGRNRTKTPQVYREYRDFMVDTYRLDPTEYLTVTACRRNLAGDVCTIMRVHAFLEQWGLINYQIDPETRPSLLTPQFTGHFQVVLDTPRGLQPFTPAEGSKSSEGEVEDSITDKKLEQSAKQSKDKDVIPVNLELRRNIYDSAADAGALVDEKTRKYSSVSQRTYNCYTCGEDTTSVRFYNLQSKQSTGALCFKHGFFPSNFNSSDFVKLEQSQNAGSNWTEQEVLLLLEGVEMYENDWDSIAYHVGTRTREACVIKFLQLPIEDPYLIKNAANKGGDGPQETDKGVTSILKTLHKLQKSLTNANGSSDLSSRAAELAKQEADHQSKLTSSLVEAQLRKFELKMKKFEEMEAILNEERRSLERARQRLYLDRLSLNGQAQAVVDKLKEAAELGPHSEDAIALAEEAKQLAAKDPKLSVVTGDGGEGRLGKIVPKPALKPLSIDTPQTFKLWTP